MLRQAALEAALKEAGALPDGPDGDLANLRKIDCALEGHPTFRSPWCRVATGSLGQGLSAAAGMALARRLDGDAGSRVDARVTGLDEKIAKLDAELRSRRSAESL